LVKPFADAEVPPASIVLVLSGRAL
jgi:hypothetical protein